MDSGVIIAVISLLGTLIGGYFTFRNRWQELKKEQNIANQTAIQTANTIMFEQIQTELKRRDDRITQLETKQDKLEKEREEERTEREKRFEEEKKRLQQEKEKTAKLEKELQQEKQCRLKIEEDFEKLKIKVIELETENKQLKEHQKQLARRLETGDLSKS